MGTWYIKKMECEEDIIDKSNIFKKIIARIRMCLKVLDIKEIGNKTIVILPVFKIKELNEKQQEKLAAKLAKRLYDKPNQNLVLSNDIDLPAFKNYLHSQGCNILDGRWLFNYLLPQVVDYVAQKQGANTETLEVSIMINDNSETTLKNIIEIAQKVKMLNIVTNDIEKFRRIEEYLYENKGIIVRLTNNRKKALLKSNLILNLDFPEEFVNQYVIPKKSIIVNTREKIVIFSKRFSGINCNYYQISLPEKYKKWFEENNIYHNFDEAVLYESILYKRGSYESILKEIMENDCKIKSLIGNKGKICDDEFMLKQ